MNRTCVSTRLKVAELRDICVGMGISTEGTKKDLLRRINDFTNSLKHINILFEKL